MTALPLKEVMEVWDRIVGLDSLLVVPVLAAAVLFVRKRAVMDCKTANEVYELFADISQLRIVPLLQHILFMI